VPIRCATDLVFEAELSPREARDAAEASFEERGELWVRYTFSKLVRTEWDEAEIRRLATCVQLNDRLGAFDAVARAAWNPIGHEGGEWESNVATHCVQVAAACLTRSCRGDESKVTEPTCRCHCTLESWPVHFQQPSR